MKHGENNSVNPFGLTLVINISVDRLLDRL
jgi:hypothetical protein